MFSGRAGFGDVIDDEIHPRTAADEFGHFGQLWMIETEVESEPEFREQPDSGEEVVAERPAGFAMMSLDQTPDAASERHFRVLGELGLDP